MRASSSAERDSARDMRAASSVGVGSSCVYLFCVSSSLSFSLQNFERKERLFQSIGFY